MVEKLVPDSFLKNYIISEIDWNYAAHHLLAPQIKLF